MINEKHVVIYTVTSSALGPEIPQSRTEFSAATTVPKWATPLPIGSTT